MKTYHVLRIKFFISPTELIFRLGEAALQDDGGAGIKRSEYFLLFVSRMPQSGTQDTILIVIFEKKAKIL
jgi:hypothetical protein